MRPLDAFVRWLARVRAPIQTKLLVALGVLAVLLTALVLSGSSSCNFGRPRTET